MPLASETTLQKMVDIIVRESDPERIILFGSQARCDARDTSDVDLIVVMGNTVDNAETPIRVTGRILKALAALRIGADVLVYTPEEFEYWSDSLNHVIARALREGRTLYARSEDDARVN